MSTHKPWNIHFHIPQTQTLCYTHTRVGWKVHRLTMMQWLNLTKCGLFFYIASPAVHTLLPSVLQCLDSGGIEALILILEKVLNCRYDFIICLILLLSQVFFLCWGTKNSQMVPNQENMAAIAATDLCAGSLSWWNRTHSVSFSGHFWNASITTFQSPEWLNPVWV